MEDSIKLLSCVSFLSVFALFVAQCFKMTNAVRQLPAVFCQLSRSISELFHMITVFMLIQVSAASIYTISFHIETENEHFQFSILATHSSLLITKTCSPIIIHTAWHYSKHTLTNLSHHLQPASVLHSVIQLSVNKSQFPVNLTCMYLHYERETVNLRTVTQNQ